MARKDEAEKPYTPEGCVQMGLREGDAKGGPTTAWVHTEEVENWKGHGWFLVVEE